jgi:hypothetical protein
MLCNESDLMQEEPCYLLPGPPQVRKVNQLSVIAAIISQWWQGTQKNPWLIPYVLANVLGGSR